MTTEKAADLPDDDVSNWVEGSVKWDKAKWDGLLKVSEEYFNSEIEKLREGIKERIRQEEDILNKENK